MWFPFKRKNERILYDDGSRPFESLDEKKREKEDLMGKIQKIKAMRRAYDFAISQINYSYRQGYLSPLERDPQEKRLEYLEFLLKVFRNDIVAAAHSHYFCGEEEDFLDSPLFPTCRAKSLPKETVNVGIEPATIVTVDPRCANITIDVQKVAILAVFHKPSSIIQSVKDITPGPLLPKTKRSYTAIYYPEIGLAKVTNGRHHVGVASIIGKGTLTCGICSLRDSFHEYYTDGAIWHKKGEKEISDEKAEPLDLVQDYRLAVIFSLGQAIQQIKYGGEMPAEKYLLASESFL